MPARHKCFSAFKVVGLSLLLALGACDTLRTRNEVPPTAHPTHHETAPSGQTTTTALPAPPPSAPIPPSPPAAPPGPPSFLNKELPKVGLILGPGGMKAYAHLGVLREFARARIPVHAVTGLEWGGVIGALYAMQGQVNDAEWKAFKLKERDLPGEGGFLSSRLKPESIATMNEFFDTVFGSASIERSRIDFACPAYWSHVDRFGWMNRGQIREAMRACLPYPPFFTDNAGVVAAPFSVEEAAAYLRSRGANLIVLVNVLGNGEFLPPKMAAEEPTETLLWSEIRREMLRARSPSVHFVINVNTVGHPVTDFAGRRQLMEAGAKAASDVVGKMSNQYGF